MSSRKPSQLRSKSYDPEERELVLKFPVNPILFKPVEVVGLESNPPFDPERIAGDELSEPT